MKRRYIIPSVRVLCPDNSDIIAQSVLLSNETIDNDAEYDFLGRDNKSPKKDNNIWDSGW
ncbi:MAG: hypothetical protein J6U94_06030 [Paludibacteraceae bacterium]|nr:hypothetical protein [Paludibacteraceae bacterium]